MNVKIEQESDFDVDNSRQMFFDAQEAKKGERTYSSSSMNLAVSRQKLDFDIFFNVDTKNAHCAICTF